MIPPSINLPPPYHQGENTPPQSPTRSTPRSLTFTENARLQPYSPKRIPNLTNVEESNNEGDQAPTTGPFNFQPTTYIPGQLSTSPQKPAELGRRRGHKYARSSVSHALIPSPAPKTPLQLPTSLPVPTLAEFRSSMTSEQNRRFAWCFCHLAVAAFVQTSAHGSLSKTTLSHLLFFDALGAFLHVAVDVARNFEVWNRGTLSHPFGLQRSEVLAGLASNIILLFMGLDLISHGLKDTLGEAHIHEHHHEVHSHSVNFPAVLGICSTVFSASFLGGESRTRRARQKSSQYLPISLAILLVVTSLFGVPATGAFDVSLSFLYASAMIVLGIRLCYKVGRMLLMSYSGSGVRQIVDDIVADPAVVSVQEANVWQVHYSLCMASFKLKARSADQVDRVRDRIASLVKNRLGGGYGEGSKGVRWEISSQITIDT